jgi:cysteine desulfurase
LDVMPPEMIYLDYNASTPCDPRVVSAMLPQLQGNFANPTSRSHRPGQQASSVLEDARARVARALGARAATEVTLTSGATEANNLALKGAADALAARGRHIITQVTEHPSVLEPLQYLAKQGWQLTVLGVDREGRVPLDEIADAIRPDTVLLSLMLANNETGTLQPLRPAVELARERGVVVHCDAAQGPGKVPVIAAELGVDMLTVSAHKAYGPKGAGALYLRRTAPPLRLAPILHGGGQEGGLRSGTPNLPAMTGMAEAFEISANELHADATRIRSLRDLLERSILDQLAACTVNGAVGHRLPGTSNISFDGVNGNALLASLPDLAVSSGAACSSGSPDPSPVLQAMGVARELAGASVRFSLGRFTTDEEVERAIDRVVAEVTRLRSHSRPPRSRRS